VSGPFRRLPLVVPVLLCVLLLGGCRGAEKAARPASPVSASPVSANRVSGNPVSGNPLAGIEATVDAVERDVDSDASGAGSGADLGR
jgi:hypothetical protein